RIAMYLQGVNSIFDIVWAHGVTYGEMHHQDEVEFSKYNFEEADGGKLQELFKIFESEGKSLLEKGLALPAYDHCLKCSHVFNILNARGVISIAERASYIGRVRDLARRSAELYLQGRETRGFPLLRK
ncbi:MAG: glycine--tRNA ligase subunit alpha, partial [Proteobacteria bacterium]|nr:glycine--tRNA ligase subunit alpha [Pseudomonadota bacterium]